MGATTSSPSPPSSTTPSYFPEYDIIQSVPPTGYISLSFIEFCTGLPSSQEATHASVMSVTRWVNRLGVPHRFLILHVVVSTGNRDLFFRLDRRRDPQESSVSSSSQSTASDGVRSIHTITVLPQMINIIIIGSDITSPPAPFGPKGDQRSRVEINGTSTTRRDWTNIAGSVRYMP